MPSKARTNGEWRYYGGDTGTRNIPRSIRSTSPTSKISRSSGDGTPRNRQAPRTSLGSHAAHDRRNALFHRGYAPHRVAVDAATGETLWMYRARRRRARQLWPAPTTAASAYWSDGKGDDRILFVFSRLSTGGAQRQNRRRLSSLRRRLPVDLSKGLDRPVVKPGTIGSTSPPHRYQRHRRSRCRPQSRCRATHQTKYPRLHSRLRRSHRQKPLDLPHRPPGRRTRHRNLGKQDSWKYTGNTGAWAPLSGDEELGYVYIPVEIPTGDFYGGTPRRKSLLRQPRLPRRPTGKAHLVLPARSSRNLGFRHRRSAHPPRHHRRRQKNQSPRAGKQIGVHFCLRPHHRQARLAHREKPVPQSNVPGE